MSTNSTSNSSNVVLTDLDGASSQAETDPNESLTFTQHVQEIWKQLKQIDKGKRGYTEQTNIINHHTGLIQKSYYEKDHHIASLEIEIKRLQLQVEELKFRYPPLETSTNARQERRPFNLVAAPPATTRIPAKAPETSHIIRIMPKSQTEVASHEQTMNILKQTVSTTGVGVKKMKRYRNKGLMIECRSAHEVKTINDALTGHEHLSAEVPKRRSPVFTFFWKGRDLPSDIDTELKTRNLFELSDGDKFEVLNQRSTDNGNTIVTLRVPPSAYKLITDNPRNQLFLGWDTIELREQDPTLQCRSCGRFGHKSAHCRFKSDGVVSKRCLRCSTYYISHHECSNPPKCCNCVEFNDKSKDTKAKSRNTDHYATDKECPTYLKAYIWTALTIFPSK